MLKTINNMLSKKISKVFLQEHDLALNKSEHATWAISYIKRHALRCYDDASNIEEINPSPSNILNIGGAPYILEFFLKKKYPNTNIVTLDLEPERFSALILEMKCKVHKIDIEKELSWLVIDEGSFDIICLCEVFEHMRIDIINTLKSISTNLKSDGVFYLTTPNGASFIRVLQNLLKRRTGPAVDEWKKLTTIGHMGHVREYSTIEVIELLNMSGFNVEKIIYRNRATSSSLKGKFLEVIRNIISKIFNSLADDLIIIATRS